MNQAASSPTKRSQTLLAIGAALVLVIPVKAQFVFESGQLTSSNRTALALTDVAWPLQRFSLSSRTRISAVGGNFSNPGVNSPALSTFGAVVSLTGPADFPDLLNLSTPDLLGTTLLELPPDLFGDVSEELALLLEPGWYALVFGFGKFGASSNTSPIVRMLDCDIDRTADQGSYTAIQSFMGGPGFFQLQGAKPRMFVAGAVVPEPSSSLLAAIAVLLCLPTLISRWRTVKR